LVKNKNFRQKLKFRLKLKVGQKFLSESIGRAKSVPIRTSLVYITILCLFILSPNFFSKIRIKDISHVFDARRECFFWTLLYYLHNSINSYHPICYNYQNCPYYKHIIKLFICTTLIVYKIFVLLGPWKKKSYKFNKMKKSDKKMMKLKWRKWENK